MPDPASYGIEPHGAWTERARTTVLSENRNRPFRCGTTSSQSSANWWRYNLSSWSGSCVRWIFTSVQLSKCQAVLWIRYLFIIIILPRKMEEVKRTKQFCRLIHLSTSFWILLLTQDTSHIMRRKLVLLNKCSNPLKFVPSKYFVFICLYLPHAGSLFALVVVGLCVFLSLVISKVSSLPALTDA